MSRLSASILGCGWLGLPLAQRLVQEDFSVKGSTTHQEKMVLLKDAGIEPFLIQIDDKKENLTQAEDFFQSDILFLNIPFYRNLKDPQTYQKQNQSVLSLLNKNIKLLLFASSTSVYSSDVKDANEDISIIPQSERQKVLRETEEDVLNGLVPASVLRFSGLVGRDREIGGFLSEESQITGGDDPVNLVHLDDCVEIIGRIMKLNLSGSIFNICCDGHPSKKELYAKVCGLKSQSLPQFIEPYQTSVKIVNNTKIKSVLNYQFKHPHPFDFITHA